MKSSIHAMARPRDIFSKGTSIFENVGAEGARILLQEASIILKMDSSAPRVLVTGVSGYVASHIVVSLLALGYRVRGTIRSIAKRPAFLADPFPSSRFKLELVEADLLQPESWPAAVAGCTYVLHVASPYSYNVKDPEELIRPAVEGTLNVLRAVAACPASEKPHRVVLTSSIASVAYGRPVQPEKVFTEADWSDANSTGHGMGAYQRRSAVAP